jgi:methyl-accepting chemotaxis protein
MKKISNLPIRKQLIVSYSVVVVLLVLLAFVVLNLISSIDSAGDDSAASYQLKGLIKDTKYNLLNDKYIVMEILEADDQSSLDEWNNAYKKNVIALNDNIKQINQIYLDKDWKTKYSKEMSVISSSLLEFEALKNELNPILEQIILKSGNRIAIKKSSIDAESKNYKLRTNKIETDELDGQFDAIADKIIFSTNQLDENNAIVAVYTDTTYNSVLSTSNIIIWIVGLLTLLSTVYFAITIIKKLHAILGEDPAIVASYVDKVAVGNLSFSIVKNKGYESIGLLKSVERMIENLSKAGNFSKEIGRGNLDAQLDILSSDDELGKSLLEMKANLVEAKKLSVAAQREIDARVKLMDELCIVSEVDLKGYITYVNDKHCEVSQYTREELIGQNQNIVRHPDMPKEVFKELWATIARGQVFRGPVKNKKKDGTPYYVDGVFAPVLGVNGKPIKYIGVRYENTQQTFEKQAAEGIVNAINTSYAYIEFDKKGIIITANDNFLKVLGYSLNEIVGKHHRMFVEGSFANSSAYTKFWDELATGIPQNDLFKRITRAGKEIWIQAVYSPVKDEMGRITKVVKIATDVTAATEAAIDTQLAADEVTRVLGSLAEGDLTQHYEIETKGNLKVMGESLNKTIDTLSELISTVVSNAENIAAASVEISSSASQLSEGATNQASSVEQISSSMEEMTANIQQNTSNSRQTEKISSQAAVDILESKESVLETVDSMKTIASKISIIGEISRQTNLLALNAAVEAARAGEHGRGFAVVAAEVRKLAERSQMAATEIDEVSSRSVSVAQRSGEMLNDVVPSIQKTSDLVQEITASSVEQSSGSDQINSAIQNLNNVVQENAATAEEMAAGAEELNAQAEILKDAVSFFKLDSNQSIMKPKKEAKLAPRKNTVTTTKPNSSSKNGSFNIKLDDKLDDDFMSF